jgi:hypothetical protein
MTDPSPTRSTGKAPGSIAGIVIALLPLAFVLLAPIGLAGPNAGRGAIELVLLLMAVPISILTWLVWRGRKGQPAWAWRAAIVVDVIAVAALVAAAVVVSLRPH